MTITTAERVALLERAVHHLADLRNEYIAADRRADVADVSRCIELLSVERREAGASA